MTLLCFRLEEDGVLTDCSIKTQEPDEILDFNFSSDNVVNKIIMKVKIYFYKDQQVDSFVIYSVQNILNHCSQILMTCFLSV